jgi:general secretion pathway protein D
LTLSGTAADIAGMLEAVSIFDVDVMKGMSFALVPVRSSDPATIADELRTVFASETEGPMAGMVQFLPNKRLGSVLVISPAFLVGLLGKLGPPQFDARQP